MEGLLTVSTLKILRDRILQSPVVVPSAGGLLNGAVAFGDVLHSGFVGNK